MTVGQLEARLKHYPREATVLILATTQQNGQEGIPIMDELIATFVSPDTQTTPNTVFLVPQHELVKAPKAE